MDTKLNCGIFVVLSKVIEDNLQELTTHLMTIKNKNSGRNDVETLCYCYGLCNTLASSDIFNDNGAFLIEIIEILRTIADKHSNEQTMLLGVCRALAQMTKSFLTLHAIAPSLENNTKTVSMTDLVAHCLSFVWSYFIWTQCATFLEIFSVIY